jgi:hypothetical protein
MAQYVSGMVDGNHGSDLFCFLSFGKAVFDFGLDNTNIRVGFIDGQGT